MNPSPRPYMMNPKIAKQRTQLLRYEVLPPEFVLPLDMWREVLARLPAKTLIRFRCVCKAWCSTIYDPDFVEMHLSSYKYNNDKNRLVVMASNIDPSTKFNNRIGIHLRDKFTLTRLTKIKNDTRYQVIGNCNGLLLLKVCGKWSTALFLWNPSIRKFIMLNDHSVSGYDSFIFGYVASSNDYKVFAFEFNCGEKSMYIAVYLLNDRLWSTKFVMMDFPVIFTRWMIFQSCCYCYFDGAAHWMVSDGEGEFDNAANFTHVLSFNLGVEKFSYVMLPQVEDENMLKFLFVLGKSLAILGISSTNTRIWIMRTDGGDEDEDNPWSLWFSGESTWEVYNFFRHSYKVKIFYDENTGTFIVVPHARCFSEPMSYNIRTYQLQRLRTCYDHCWSIEYVDTYVESLVLCTERQALSLNVMMKSL